MLLCFIEQHSAEDVTLGHLHFFLFRRKTNCLTLYLSFIRLLLLDQLQYFVSPEKTAVVSSRECYVLRWTYYLYWRYNDEVLQCRWSLNMQENQPISCQSLPTYYVKDSIVLVNKKQSSSHPSPYTPPKRVVMSGESAMKCVHNWSEGAVKTGNQQLCQIITE